VTPHGRVHGGMTTRGCRARGSAFRLLCEAGLAAALLLSRQARAQSVAQSWTRAIWYSYSADHPAGQRWQLHLEGSYRPTIGSPARQWMVRPSVNIRLADPVVLSLAYGYFDTHPGGLAVDDGETREHRFQQQLEYSARVFGPLAQLNR